MVPELALSRTAERLRTSERMSDMAEYDRFSTVTVQVEHTGTLCHISIS